MPLNLSVGDGDFTPFIKYNAKAGRFYVKPEGAESEVEIVNPVLAFDMANIKTGWIYYAEGTGPEKIWDPDRVTEAAKPPGPKKFKRGFEVVVYSPQVIPGTRSPIGVREFSSTAGNVINAMLMMYEEYEQHMAENRDCIPVYACQGVKPINGVYGTNYEPQFKLIKWVPRSKYPELNDDRTRRATTPSKPTGNGGVSVTGNVSGSVAPRPMRPPPGPSPTDPFADETEPAMDPADIPF